MESVPWTSWHRLEKPNSFTNSSAIKTRQHKTSLSPFSEASSERGSDAISSRGTGAVETKIMQDVGIKPYSDEICHICSVSAENSRDFRIVTEVATMRALEISMLPLVCLAGTQNCDHREGMYGQTHM